MEKSIYTFCCPPVHPLGGGKLLQAGVPDGLQGFKPAHQRLSPGWPDALDIIQDRADLSLAPEAPVVFDGKPVGLVLDPGDQLKALAVPVNGDLHILVIKAPGPVIIILDHAADRDREPQTLQDLQGHVYLAPSAVHHDHLHILVIKAPGPVIIILDHAADRDREPQTLQDLQGHVYLAPSAVHHDQIREAGEAPEPFHVSRLPVRRLHGHPGSG